MPEPRPPHDAAAGDHGTGLNGTGMIGQVPARGILHVGGADAVPFLQALVTNNVEGLAPGHAAYAALLTPQGKYLHDFFVVPAPGGDGLLLEMQVERLPDLLRRLTMYKLRSRVTLADRSADWHVMAFTGDARADSLPDGAIAFDDPRHPDLGQRVFWPASSPLPPLNADAADLDRHRLSLGIPDPARDFEIEKSFMLEVGFDRLNGVDFRKGCYVGQEITARSKYRGNVRKMLTPCTVDGPLPAPGTPVTADGKEVGDIRSGAGDRVIAMLRLDRPEGVLRAGPATLTPDLAPTADAAGE